MTDEDGFVPHPVIRTEVEARAAIQELFALLVDTVGWTASADDYSEAQVLFLAGFTLAAVNPEWARRLQALISSRNAVLVQLWALPAAEAFPVAEP